MILAIWLRDPFLFVPSSGILSGISSGILSGISSGILSDMLSGVLSGISSGILSGRWGPAALTELGKSQVEVQRCSLSSAGPRLRSSGAHWARRVPGWGPAVLTELGRSQVEVQRCSLNSAGPRLRSSGAHCAQTLAVEVQQCPLRAEVGAELGEELARRKWTWKWQKWTWKWMQRWWRRRRRRRRRRTTLIKSNNPPWQVGKYVNTNLEGPQLTQMFQRLGN